MGSSSAPLAPEEPRLGLPRAGHACARYDPNKPCTNPNASSAAWQVLEKARQAKLLGSSLEARVLLWVEDARLAEALRAWDARPNAADPLRFMFIVSQARRPFFPLPCAAANSSLCEFGKFGRQFVAMLPAGALVV